MQRHTSILKRILWCILFIAGGSLLMGIVIAQDTQDKPLAPIIKSPSSVGEVTFPHQLHFEDLELECLTCHHETNAATLQMPHPEYFDDFWINCKICHKGSGAVVSQPQSCSNCHHDSPTDIADETLSAKVVVHKQCWGCHELETGEKASQSCSDCHVKDPDKKGSL